MGLFEHRGKANDIPIPHHGPDNLDPRRQAIRHDAAGHGNGRVAGHVERMGIGIPGLPDAAGGLIADGDGLVEIMIGGNGRSLCTTLSGESGDDPQ